MSTLPLRFWPIATALLVAACQTAPPVHSVAGIPTRQVAVNGVKLTYVDQGRGAPVVFVHGSLSDLRAWEAQRLAVAQRYRYIAFTQRYFGTGRWPGSGRDFSQEAHAADLAAFIQSLNAGPVHLVGWSYGGLTALLVARSHPELVRSLTLHEPGIRSLIADTPEGRQAWAEFSRSVVPAAAAAKAGDTVRAAKLFTEALYALPPEGFDAQPAPFRRMVLDNARTMSLALTAPPPPAITCESVRAIRVPTLVTHGEAAQTHYRMISERLTACMPNAVLAVIPGTNHDAPMRNPAVFNGTLLGFLARTDSRGRT
ncbi:MAG TPA: alpha/beta hydrolase [Burkholderiales bacterium]|jgi:pimeloyl-ACP methyl ester carboxylesterase|nr:alpha/beta hydrolase [Burkholderiales bacterium]